MQPPRVIEFSTVREPTAEYMEYLWEKSVLLWSLVSQTVSYRRKMIDQLLRYTLPLCSLQTKHGVAKLHIDGYYGNTGVC